MIFVGPSVPGGPAGPSVPGGPAGVGGLSFGINKKFTMK